MKRKRKSGPERPVERVFHARVREVLVGVMAARGLQLLSGGPEGVATLLVPRCWVKLQLEADGAVTSCLYDVNGGGFYELDGYLRLVGHAPTAWTMEGVRNALASGVLDGPLAGDFSWARDYWLLVEELLTVAEELIPVLRRGGGVGGYRVGGEAIGSMLLGVRGNALG